MKQKRRKVKRDCQNSLDIPSSIWLKKNGLYARKLTVLQVLNPTIVKIQPHFVPMLTKDTIVQVLINSPSAHKSPNQLLSLARVDLHEYEERLKASIIEYKKRVDMIVWRNLTQEERDKFESGPVSYIKDQDALNQVLDRLGWPVPQMQLQLMLDEIFLGQRYLRECLQMQESFNETRISLNDVMGTEQQKFKSPQEKQYVLPVIARDSDSGYFYDGVIKGRSSPGRYLVSFRNGGEGNIERQHCFLKERPQALLQVGDYTLAYCNEDECYYPGMVIGTPRNRVRQSKYCVLLFNKSKMYIPRESLAEIDDWTYKDSVDYIKVKESMSISEEETSPESLTDSSGSSLEEQRVLDMIVAKIPKKQENKREKSQNLVVSKRRKENKVTSTDMCEIKDKLKVLQFKMSESSHEMELQRKALKLQSQILLNLVKELEKSKALVPC